ncbi:MAG: rRNA methyltransferase, partial [Bacillus sp. (in: firmicutes)]
MNIDKILPFAKSLLIKAVKPGDVVIDATVGNGYDSVFLAELVGESGQVF